MSVPETGQRNSSGGSTVVVNDEDGEEDAEEGAEVEEEAANGLHRDRAVAIGLGRVGSRMSMALGCDDGRLVFSDG
jgi:hypothetical protein